MAELEVEDPLFTVRYHGVPSHLHSHCVRMLVPG